LQPTDHDHASLDRPSFAAVKGILHAPGAKPTMKPESREALLTAIVKARGWIDESFLDYLATADNAAGFPPLRSPIWVSNIRQTPPGPRD
jgi:hypothetical protein